MNPGGRFVDEQLRGPYGSWRHERLFLDAGEETRIRDRVRHDMPWGRVINRLFLAEERRRIFAFRQRKLQDLLKSPGALNPERTGGRSRS